MWVMTAPQGRARVQAILSEIAEIAEAGYALPGSLVTRTTACGRPGCRCTADPPELHGPYTSWLRRSDGKVMGTYGRTGRWPGMFIFAHDIKADSQGNVYTSETITGQRIQKWIRQ